MSGFLGYFERYVAYKSFLDGVSVSICQVPVCIHYQYLLFLLTFVAALTIIYRMRYNYTRSAENFPEFTETGADSMMNR